MSRLRGTVVVAILIAGAALRLPALDRVPLPVQQDELSDIYDGYSIAETGADRSGMSYPIILRGFGEADYRPALYAWLAAIPAKLAGFSIVAGRLPSALLGCVALVLLYAFARGLGGWEFAVATLALAAFSPWLVSFSRVAHQGAMLPPFFLILILFLWQRTASRNLSAGWLMALGLAVGLSANAYQSTRLTALLFALCIATFVIKNSSRRSRDLTLFGAAAFIGALPQVIVLLTDPVHFAARSQDTLVKANTAFVFIGTAVKNFGINLGPRYLFVPNMAETYLTSARLLPVEILLFYPGLVAIMALRGETVARFRPWLYAALVIAVLPAALANQNPHSLRASGLAILTPLFSAATVVALRDWIRRHRLPLAAFDALFAASILASAGLVAFMYFRSPDARGARMQSGITRAAERVAARQTNYRRVFFENAGNQPYLYVVSFTGMTPREYMTVPKDMGSSSGRMDVVRRVGKYLFLDSLALDVQARESAASKSRDLFVARKRLPGMTVLDSVGWRWQGYYIMEPSRR